MNNRTVDRCDYNVGEYINNRYRVSQTLGEGSFGKVYRVTDSASKDYALKLLRLWEVPPEIRKPLMERFEMEFKTGQIDCDYLVRSLTTVQLRQPLYCNGILFRRRFNTLFRFWKQ